MESIKRYNLFTIIIGILALIIYFTLHSINWYSMTLYIACEVILFLIIILAFIFKNRKNITPKSILYLFILPIIIILIQGAIGLTMEL